MFWKTKVYAVQNYYFNMFMNDLMGLISMANYGVLNVLNFHPDMKYSFMFWKLGYLEKPSIQSEGIICFICMDSIFVISAESISKL